MRDFYGSRGYVDMVAMPEVLPSGPGAVDVIYRIDEGVQSYVNLVNIQGNTRTKDRVLRRELAVKPGDIFDTTLVDVEPQAARKPELLLPGRYGADRTPSCPAARI